MSLFCSRHDLVQDFFILRNKLTYPIGSNTSANLVETHIEHIITIECANQCQKMQQMVCATFDDHVVRKHSAISESTDANCHWQCSNKKPNHCSKGSLQWIAFIAQEHVEKHVPKARTLLTPSFFFSTSLTWIKELSPDRAFTAF